MNGLGVSARSFVDLIKRLVQKENPQMEFDFQDTNSGGQHLNWHGISIKVFATDLVVLRRLWCLLENEKIVG